MGPCPWGRVEVVAEVGSRARGNVDVLPALGSERVNPGPASLVAKSWRDLWYGRKPLGSVFRSAAHRAHSAALNRLAPSGGRR